MTREEFYKITKSDCHYCGSPPLTLHTAYGGSEYLYNGIDRIDNDKGYSSDNCRWTTILEQNRNKRDTKLTLQLARIIRSSTGSCRELAIKYGTSESSIWLVKANKTWREDDESNGGAN